MISIIERIVKFHRKIFKASYKYVSLLQILSNNAILIYRRDGVEETYYTNSVEPDPTTQQQHVSISYKEYR